MSGYPRPDASSIPVGPFLPDRIVGGLKIATTLLGSVSYFNAFYRYWSHFAPGVSIFAWAPPLGSHVTTQTVGLIHGVFTGLGVWYGRGWAFAYVLLTTLGALVLDCLVRPSSLGYALAFLVYLPTFLYCGLRLVGQIGPPTGAFELRRSD